MRKTITVQINPLTNWLIVSFPEKPSVHIRKAMTAHGFRWHNERRKWLAYNTPERMAFLNSL